jgi:molybdopterin synthase catalytic subunit
MSLPARDQGASGYQIAIVRAAIDPAAVLALVGDHANGAVLLFLGTVRDHADGRPVGGLRYEAYQAMAEKALNAIAGEAVGQLGTDRIAVVHRVGNLAVGEVSVAIAVSSPHRAEAYQASRFIIEEIKKRLPVWKHEQYVDGEAGWVQGQTIELTEDAR